MCCYYYWSAQSDEEAEEEATARQHKYVSNEIKNQAILGEIESAKNQYRTSSPAPCHFLRGRVVQLFATALRNTRQTKGPVRLLCNVMVK